MKVSDYLPELYKNNIEMNSLIHSEEIELENNLKPDIDNSFKNTFITQANELGIKQYEDIFNIKPDKLIDTLEFRRERVLNRLISKIPFTERYLINSLNSILGENNWEYIINYNDYTLNIISIKPGQSWLKELYSFLERTIPCNILYNITIYSATWQLVNDTLNTWETVYNTEMSWQELMDAEWSA